MKAAAGKNIFGLIQDPQIAPYGTITDGYTWSRQTAGDAQGKRQSGIPTGKATGGPVYPEKEAVLLPL